MTPSDAPPSPAADLEDLNRATLAALNTGRSDEALAAALRALDLGGEHHADSRQLFVQAVRRAPPGHPDVRRRLAQALREGWARPDVLGGLAIAQLRAAWPNTAQAIAADELLAETLSSAPIRDPEMERRLIAIRRGVVLARGPALLPLLGRLADQCHLNEYAWASDAEEAGLAAALEQTVSEGRASASDLLALACNRALDEVAGVEALVEQDWPGPVRRVLDEQVALPRAARAEAAAVRALTTIEAPVSVAVRRQYEENPYPRWTRFASPTPIAIDALMAALFPQAPMDPIPNAEAPEILVAGCGTGQEAILAAQRHPQARVLGVDLSRASLGYAAARARQAGSGNLDFAQADILALDGRGFDVVTASGVLHHMADPFAGARVLAGLLRPGGVMKIGLYSAVARAVLSPAKALARSHPPTAEGIRALRAAILRAAPGDPVRGVLGIADFYTLSACRDLLMHVQEHEMSIADIRRMLAETSLKFLGFAVDAPVAAAYRREFPDDPAALDLTNWAAFEARHPATFIGMYQFWAQKPA